MDDQEKINWYIEGLDERGVLLIKHLPLINILITFFFPSVVEIKLTC